MQNKKIHDYTLKRKLGQGGMAEVWYAENVLGNPAAVKILLKEFSFNEQVVQRFESEAKIMVKLKHPNIRKVISYGEIDERPVIIMEYLEGEDLSQKLHKHHAYTNEDLIHWWNEAVKALNHTHSKGIIHRDIKPSNLFITNEGELKLLDFGIAKIKEGVTYTKTGQTMGTPLYMSPEQVRDSKHIDKSSDAYSLAISFVQLVSRQNPYRLGADTSDFDMRTAIVSQEVQTDDLPLPWNTLLTNYLYKDSSQRQALQIYKKEETVILDTEKTEIIKNEKEEIKEQNENNNTHSKHPPRHSELDSESHSKPQPPNKKGVWIGLGVVALLLIGVFIWQGGKDKPNPIPEKVENIQETVKPKIITETVNGISFKMIEVKSGTFQMGSNSGNNYEKPIHSVTVPTFYMGRTEVTHKQYISFLNAQGVDSNGNYQGKKYVDMDAAVCTVGYKNNRFYFKGSKRAETEDTPMINVTWDKAKAYCAWLSQQTGKTYRLPSESEWEYAARGGNRSKGYKYAGSNNIDKVAWYGYEKSGKQTHQVGTKQPNELGLYDMSGNVSEWCEDKWHDSYRGAPTDGSAWLSGSSSRRILRGGCWYSYAENCRSANRGNNSTVSWFINCGFRVVLEH